MKKNHSARMHAAEEPLQVIYNSQGPQASMQALEPKTDVDRQPKGSSRLLASMLQDTLESTKFICLAAVQSRDNRCLNSSLGMNVQVSAVQVGVECIPAALLGSYFPCEWHADRQGCVKKHPSAHEILCRSNQRPRRSPWPFFFSRRSARDLSVG